jgi:lipopolysaccharide transport system permease protein
VWLYASPIIYPLTAVPEPVRPFYMLNPMAGLIDSYRRVTVLGQPPQPAYLAISAAVSIAALVAGYWTFKRAEASFADLI